MIELLNSLYKVLFYTITVGVVVLLYVITQDDEHD